MEIWAQRIQDLMQGRSQADLARACGVKAGSVSGWFGQGKPTKMISGDNLVAAARFLGTTAEFIMTGKGASADPSRPVGLDPEKLATVLAIVDGAIRDSRKRVPEAFRARMIKRVYESQHEVTTETANAVKVALAGLLDTLERP